MNTQWSHISIRLQEKLSSGDFKVWISHLDGHIDYADANKPCITLKAKSQYVINWIQSRLLHEIEEACASALGTDFTIVFEVDERLSTVKTAEDLAKSLPTAPSVLATTSDPSVIQQEQAYLPLQYSSRSESHFKQRVQNFKHSFETFVVGPCNHLAYAAAKNILLPSSTTDMLFLSSHPGLGKTHLTQALGKAMYTESRANNVNMAYITSEEFSSQFIQACRVKEPAMFRNKFSALDLLLLEDIHFLKGKTKTQEELLTIVKLMQDRGGKVVFTSSLAPRDLHDIDAHLVSRFCSGYVFSLEYPDFDTKKDMLMQKALLKNFKLPEKVADLFAEQLHGDVRLLESSLDNLILRAQILNVPLTTELAYSIIAQVAPHNADMNLEELVRLVCSCFDVTEQQLTSRVRKQNFVIPRNIAYFLIRKHLGFTMQEIASRFGKKHSTISKAIMKVEEELSKNTRLGMQFKHSIDAIEARATFLA